MLKETGGTTTLEKPTTPTLDLTNRISEYIPKTVESKKESDQTQNEFITRISSGPMEYWTSKSGLGFSHRVARSYLNEPKGLHVTHEDVFSRPIQVGERFPESTSLTKRRYHFSDGTNVTITQNYMDPYESC